MLTKNVCGIFLEHNNEYQITDLLQISRQENESKIRCLCIMKRRNAWKKMHGNYTHGRSMVCAKLEGVLLKRQVQDAIFFYRQLKGRRINAFESYLNNLPSCGRTRKVAI